MITRTDIEKLAELARIKISHEEAESLVGEIEPVLEYVNQIQSVAGAGEVLPEAGAVHNIMREDGAPHEPGAFSAELLAEAPQREGEYLKVKKILGGNEES